VNKILAKESKRVIGEGRSRILRIEAIDLNGDGKKDFIGIYRFQGKYSDKGGGPTDSSLFLGEVVKLKYFRLL